eukprot:4160137-Amphidinium_carterae.1
MSDRLRQKPQSQLEVFLLHASIILLLQATEKELVFQASSTFMPGPPQSQGLKRYFPEITLRLGRGGGRSDAQLGGKCFVSACSTIHVTASPKISCGWNATRCCEYALLWKLDIPSPSVLA